MPAKTVQAVPEAMTGPQAELERHPWFVQFRAFHGQEQVGDTSVWEVVDYEDPMPGGPPPGALFTSSAGLAAYRKARAEGKLPPDWPPMRVFAVVDVPRTDS